MKYVIQKGDTLHDIAQKHLGNSSKWRLLWNINKDTLRSKNPNLIYPGEIIEIPDRNTKVQTPPVKTEKNEVFLYVNGQEYSGWKGVDIERSIEAVAGSFSLSIAEMSNFEIKEGDTVEVKIGSDTVNSGYVDDISEDISDGSHTLTVVGRDKTADLVDCSIKTGEWKNVKFEDVAKEICNLFSIEIKKDTDTGDKFPSVKAQPGETAFELLDRHARQRGLLLSSTRDGKLLITTTGKDSTGITLKEGVNIKSASITRSTKERYQKYIVLSSEENVGVSGVAQDDSIKRFRQIVMMSENEGNASVCKKRASWEAITRAARGVSLSVEVQGWRDSNDNIWTENTMVNIDIPSLKISEIMLISSVNYIKDENGTITRMTIKRKDAYTLAEKVK